MNRGLLVVVLFLLDLNSVMSQKIALEDELRCLYSFSELPRHINDIVAAQQSTYDTTGGNNDGFSGAYSFVNRNADSSLVLFDVQGPGVINRFWTPTPTKDTLDFYIDDATLPMLSICYRDLFSGKTFPFVSPLSGSGAGGFYSYFPILFQKHCKIICRGKKVQFHQVQYRLYPKNAVVTSFTGVLNPKEKTLLQKIDNAWSRIGTLPEQTRTTKKSSTAYVIAPGEAATIFKTSKGGRIVGIELNSDALLDSNLFLSITWDDETIPAVYCPAGTFFGYAYGKPSMKSLFLGETAAGGCGARRPGDPGGRRTGAGYPRVPGRRGDFLGSRRQPGCCAGTGPVHHYSLHR